MLSALLSVLAALQATTAPLCDLTPGTRPADLPGYSALADNCLAVPPRPARFDTALEAALADAINRARSEAGLPPLAVRAELQRPARFHSLDMAITAGIGHGGASGRSPFDRIAAIDRSLFHASARENVSRVGGAIDPGEIVDWIHRGLMNSPGHRANILSEDSTHMAIGVVAIEDKFFTTQLFVSQVAALSTPATPVLVAEPADGVVLFGEGRLPGWTFDGYGVETAAGAIIPLDGVAPLPAGPGRLVLRGRKPDPADPLRVFTIAYPGPAVLVR